MKLTNYIRDAFISTAMADVPKGKDYSNVITDAVVADAVAQLPAAVQRIWKDSKTRGYINTKAFRGFGVSVEIPSDQTGWCSLGPEVLSAATREKLRAVHEEWKTEKTKREQLRDRLKSAAYACTTRKALADLLPEFAQYLPPEEGPASRTVPAVANLVTDFMKAGWPKGKGGAK